MACLCQTAVFFPNLSRDHLITMGEYDGLCVGKAAFVLRLKAVSNSKYFVSDDRVMAHFMAERQRVSNCH